MVAETRDCRMERESSHIEQGQSFQTVGGSVVSNLLGAGKNGAMFTEVLQEDRDTKKNTANHFHTDSPTTGEREALDQGAKEPPRDHSGLENSKTDLDFL